MKKSISVVTLFPGASQCYAGQIRELFGDLVEVYSYSTSDQSVEKITRTDLYLVSTDAFKIAEEESQYVPADGQVVEIYVGYSKEVIRRLKEIPAGTRVLFVNVTHQMSREAITPESWTMCSRRTPATILRPWQAPSPIWERPTQP